MSSQQPKCKWAHKVSCCHIFCEHPDAATFPPDGEWGEDCVWPAAHCKTCDHYEELTGGEHGVLAI